MTRAFARGSNGRSGIRGGFLLTVTALAVAALRWWTHARLFYNWDSVQYALGLGAYDLRLHQPHPPGSPLYTLLGRCVDQLVINPHTSLILLSAAASALTIPAVYFLAREAAGGRAGVWAAGLAATAPLFWFYGSIGLNYSWDGLFGALVALYCLRLWQGRTDIGTAVLAGAALATAGGFRPTTMLFLAPLWLAATGVAARRAPRAAAASLAVAVVITLSWLLPNVAAAGGLRSYLTLNRDMGHALDNTAVWRARDPWAAVRYAAETHRRCLESTLGVAWLAIPALIFWGVRQRRHAAAGRPSLPRADDPPLPPARFWLLWIAPAASFNLLAHFNSPGYAMVYAPALVVLAAAVLDRASRPIAPRGRGAVAAVIVLGNGLLFWFGFPWASPQMGQRAISRAEIASHDGYWTALEAFVRRASPGRRLRVLTSSSSTEGLRVAEALLPSGQATVCQVVDLRPGQLPRSIERLPFLHFCRAGDVLGDAVPTLALWRTSEDRGYQRSAFGDRVPHFDVVAIGDGWQAAWVPNRAVVTPGR